MKNLFFTLLFFAIFQGVGIAQDLEEVKKASHVAVEVSDNAPTFRIFPNPAINYFQVESNQQVSKIVMFNVFGRQIESFEMRKGQKYDIESLPMGIYLVQMLDAENKIIATRRLSKRLP